MGEKLEVQMDATIEAIMEETILDAKPNAIFGTIISAISGVISDTIFFFISSIITRIIYDAISNTQVNMAVFFEFFASN